MTKNMIVKHNDIIEARYSLSMRETKLIALLASVVKRKDEGFQCHRFYAKDLLEMLDLGEKNYESLRQAIDKLEDRKLSLRRPGSELNIRFVSSSEYFDDGTIELEFSGKMAPYLLQLKENFTSYMLENILRLSSVYAFRVYELCKQYETIGERKITVADLRDILEIPETKYQKYSHFKAKVLSVAKKEINEKTDVLIEFSEKKRGRSVNEIIFAIHKKPSQETVRNIPLPRRSDAVDSAHLAEIKRSEDDRAYENQIRAVREEYQALSEADKAPFEAQLSLWDVTGDAMVIAWAKSAGKWPED